MGLRQLLTRLWTSWFGPRRRSPPIDPPRVGGAAVEPGARRIDAIPPPIPLKDAGSQGATISIIDEISDDHLETKLRQVLKIPEARRENVVRRTMTKYGLTRAAAIRRIIADHEAGR